ncbi:MAG: HepT-like ribonuclease domain-containing protein [Steroidobacteraceae bacterium]|nr:DUF86 domain-containing protein [Nevskiaceae bacterium]MCP5360754.1 DUF86 domain-containing protein [Nevskiaceae bacterium]
MPNCWRNPWQDISLHIVSASGVAAPETYGEAVRAIAPLVGLPPDLTERLGAAVRLRNILVHMYLEIDHGRLFDELDWIDDTERFAALIERWLSSQS